MHGSSTDMPARPDVVHDDVTIMGIFDEFDRVGAGESEMRHSDSFVRETLEPRATRRRCQSRRVVPIGARGRRSHSTGHGR